eukprot:scaffold1318_cov388-Prasinococcus_capsulatus_cf.AAC.34
MSGGSSRVPLCQSSISIIICTERPYTVVSRLHERDYFMWQDLRCELKPSQLGSVSVSEGVHPHAAPADSIVSLQAEGAPLPASQSSASRGGPRLPAAGSPWPPVPPAPPADALTASRSAHVTRHEHGATRAS